MKHSIITLTAAVAVAGGAASASAQQLNLQPYRDFTYPQTPSFTDLTQPTYNASSIDTVASLRKRERMSDTGGSRDRYRNVSQIYVMPGGLEPTNEYKLALGQLLGVKYRPGTFSFSGPADALVGITNFAWGTENNNSNFLPLLIRADYQDIRTPAYEFNWTMPAEYRIDGNRVVPINNQITLNYTFKIPTQSKVDWGNSRGFNRFSAAGSIFGTAPEVAADRVFRWNNNNLETFRGTIKDALQVNINVAPPDGKNVEGVAVWPPLGMIFLALSQNLLQAYDSSGAVVWQVRARPPLLFYHNRLIAVAENYQSLIAFDARTGKPVGTVALPDFLPQYENALAAADTDAGGFLFLSVPNQSRVFTYRITE